MITGLMKLVAGLPREVRVLYEEPSFEIFVIIFFVKYNFEMIRCTVVLDKNKNGS